MARKVPYQVFWYPPEQNNSRFKYLELNTGQHDKLENCCFCYLLVLFCNENLRFLNLFWFFHCLAELNIKIGNSGFKNTIVSTLAKSGATF